MFAKYFKYYTIILRGRFVDTLYLITVHERNRQTDGRTDRQTLLLQTDSQITISIPRFALKCIAR